METSYHYNKRKKNYNGQNENNENKIIIDSIIQNEENVKEKTKTKKNKKNRQNYPDMEEVGLENFTQEKIIQDTFFEKKDDNNMRDKIYIKLKTYEKNKLTEAFNVNYHNSLNILKDNEIKMKLDKKLIAKIIKNENCEKVFIEKIKEHLEK